MTMRTFLVLILATNLPSVVTSSFLSSCNSWKERKSHVSLSATTTSTAETNHALLNRRREFLAIGGSVASWGSIAFVSPPAWSQPVASLSQVQEARDQLDLVVQACSVQAWTDAYDLVSDSSLDNIGSMIPKDEEAELVSVGIQTLRERLNRVTSLPTQDAVAVMSVGTQTRLALEKYLQKSESNL